MTKLAEPTEREQLHAARIRGTVLDAVDQLQWTDEELANKLGLLPAGARVLKERDAWSLTTAWRVAEALELTPRLNVFPYPRPKTRPCDDCLGLGMEDHWSECILCSGTGRLIAYDTDNRNTSR